jgi:hypothetical protein
MSVRECFGSLSSVSAVEGAGFEVFLSAGPIRFTPIGASLVVVEQSFTDAQFKVRSDSLPTSRTDRSGFSSFAGCVGFVLPGAF